MCLVGYVSHVDEMYRFGGLSFNDMPQVCAAMMHSKVGGVAIDLLPSVKLQVLTRHGSLRGKKKERVLAMLGRFFGDVEEELAVVSGYDDINQYMEDSGLDAIESYIGWSLE